MTTAQQNMQTSLDEEGLNSAFAKLDSARTGSITTEQLAGLCKELKLHLTPREMCNASQGGKVTLSALRDVVKESRYVNLVHNMQKEKTEGKENIPMPYAIERIKSLERKQSKTIELKSKPPLSEPTSAKLSPIMTNPPKFEDGLLSASSSSYAHTRDSLTSSAIASTPTATTASPSPSPGLEMEMEMQNEFPLSSSAQQPAVTYKTPSLPTRPMPSDGEPGNSASPFSPLQQTATERSFAEPAPLPKFEIRRASGPCQPTRKTMSVEVVKKQPLQPQYLQASQTEKALGSGRTSLLQNMMGQFAMPSLSPRMIRMPFNREVQVFHQDSFSMLSPHTRDENARDQLGRLTRAYGAVFGHKEVDQFPGVRREYRPKRAGVYQDMDRPLSHYFISSGHNSYLKGNQLTSASSTKPIAEALDRGCRVIELDVWSGTKEPYVVHGFTMSKKVYFSRCIKTVRKHAFRATDFPLIITLENHCNKRNKELMVKILLEELGPLLYRRPKDQTWNEFPSPNELRGYILIRDKHDSDTEEMLTQAQAGTSQSKSNNLTSLLHEKPLDFGAIDSGTTEDSEELKDLISIVNVKHHVAESSTLPVSSSRGEPSLEELNADLHGTLKHTQTHLLRTYPGAKRLDSSNYDPMLGWGCGAQIVALNWQTPGPPMWAYQGMFRDNGHCGYVKKPDWMLGDVSEVTHTDAPAKLVQVRLLSARHMRHRGIKENTVTLEMFGIGKDSRTMSSRTVRGYDCCTWDQEFMFPLRNPDCAVLVFTLRNKERFRGQVAIPINNLATGKFQMHLLNKKGFLLPGNRRHTQLVVDLSLQNITGNVKKMLGDL